MQQPRLPRDSVLHAMSAADSLSLRDAVEKLRTASLTDKQKTSVMPRHSHGCWATLMRPWPTELQSPAALDRMENP